MKAAVAVTALALVLTACTTPEETAADKARKAYDACAEKAANPHVECRAEKATADRLAKEARREIVWENIRRQAFRPAPALSTR